MKDFFGIVAYCFLVGIPGYAARYLLYEYEHPILAILVLLFGCYAALMRYTANEHWNDLKAAKQNLYKIEKNHYLESQAHKIAYDLLTEEQWREYFQKTEERHLSSSYYYEYQEFEPRQHEQDNK